MHDQILAIQWIKDNSKYFGGDPDNIVLFGESAGAWSVSLHLISPLSKNLFSRAILQSGATIHPMYSSDNKVLHMGSQMVSKIVGCAANDGDLKEDPKKVVECMKNLPSNAFFQSDEVLIKNIAFLIPRVGEEFLPEDPTDMFRKGESKDTEVLLGVTRDEGSIFLSFKQGFENGDFYGQSFDANTFNKSSAEAVIQPLVTDKNYEKIALKYMKRVKEESRYTYLHAVSDMMGDSMITCSTMFLADFQSLKNQPVYFYVFDYRSPSSPFAEWMGVPHFEETQYVFGNPFMKSFSESEKELSKDVMDMWISFAKSG